ncbi:MAG: exodeoxyribonuclease VII large subunit [Thermodesulfovibrionales bacterium]
MNTPSYSLFELNSLIRATLDAAFPETYWVVAEIAECKSNQRGHCYLDLVEKREDKVIAQSRATIWAYEYRTLLQKFQSATGETLKSGMKIMLLAAVAFHEVYGMSLNVRDIDPAYTLGEAARRRKEVIDRLLREGLLDLNRTVPLPLVPQRIAVISSPTAAGYGDFFNQLDSNPFGYRFVHTLFPAAMQGEEAERSILAALEAVVVQKERFDVAVIVRGGGSVVDLGCFDLYSLASRVARLPLPVFTGIGHEKDDSVVDRVAHTRMKTPTAVAEFLISGMRTFEEAVLALQGRMCRHCEGLLTDGSFRLDAFAQRVALVPSRILAMAHARLEVRESDVRNRARHSLQREDGRLVRMEQAVWLLDPVNVLRRGYSITRRDGKVVKDASLLAQGESIDTVLFRGTVKSSVEQTREAAESGQEQAAYLPSGADGA